MSYALKKLFNDNADYSVWLLTILSYQFEHQMKNGRLWLRWVYLYLDIHIAGIVSLYFQWEYPGIIDHIMVLKITATLSVFNYILVHHQQRIFPSGWNGSVRVDALHLSRQRHPGGGVLSARRQFNASRSISPSDRCFTVSSRSVGLLF
jgi:hypothetical protein